MRARSRASLTPADMEFILNALDRKDRKKSAIIELMSEEDFLDHLLDRNELFDQVVRDDEFTRISPFLYFYVVTRRGLRDSGIENRRVSDYIATILVEFVARERLYRISIAHDEIFHYVVDMLGYLDRTDPWGRFLVRTHIGNFSLFLLGFFIDFIETNHQFRRCLQGVNYYEDMGSSNYRLAAKSRFAEEFDLVDVLEEMGEKFHLIRRVLNDLTVRYFHFRSAPGPGEVSGKQD